MVKGSGNSRFIPPLITSMIWFVHHPEKPRGNGLQWKLWRWETIGSYLLVGIALVAAAILLGEELNHHVTAIENWLASHGSPALLIAVILYALCAVIFIPDTLLGVVAGATFGFTRGFVVAFLGSILATAIEYLLARRLLKPLIDRRLASRPAMKALQEAVKTQEFRLQFLMRLTPINRSMTSYMLGASGVKFPRFILATAGFIPHLCLEVYFGYATKHLAVVAGRSRDAIVLHDIMLAAGLLVTIIVIFLISRAAKKSLQSAVDQQVNAQK